MFLRKKLFVVSFFCSFVIVTGATYISHISQQRGSVDYNIRLESTKWGWKVIEEGEVDADGKMPLRYGKNMSFNELKLLLPEDPHIHHLFALKSTNRPLLQAFEEVMHIVYLNKFPSEERVNNNCDPSIWGIVRRDNRY